MKIYFKNAFFLLSALCITNAAVTQQTFTISKKTLADKIKGGWAGQTIGVTFGGPVEFRFCGTMIGDMQPIVWNDTLFSYNMNYNPGLYDDIYMDLTFVEVMEKYGINAPTDSFANAFANAGYVLWHANQNGRYNILQGMKAPASGHWLNNPHADDIDFQIESDFAGLMSPAMPQAAAAISDKVGHIMNYGDGWYGGVYMSTMYTLAFTSADVKFIVQEALKAIPPQSDFYKCIADVISWHKKNPVNWKQTWFELQRKWADENGCPEGIFQPFNIDAKINAAYVVMGLLYGNGDFTRTMQISARCGQDADCNPSSAGGILGTILGYDKIPAYWKQGLDKVEDMDFAYTSMSLNKTYNISLKHAQENILKNGGSINGDNITIRKQTVKQVAYEKSFDGYYPVAKIDINKKMELKGDVLEFEMYGKGFIVRGYTSEYRNWNVRTNDELLVSVSIDGGKEEILKLPFDYKTRRMDLVAYKYQLNEGKHQVKIVLLNEISGRVIWLTDRFTYASKPILSKY